MKKLLIASATIGLLATPSFAWTHSSKSPLPPASGQGFTQEGLKHIDTFFADQIASNQMPGAVLAVSKNGKLSIYKPYGYLDKDAQKPMTTDVIFNLASMTKVMATVGALTFYEEGKLPLNTPISDWLPQFKNMKVG